MIYSRSNKLWSKISYVKSHKKKVKMLKFLKYVIVSDFAHKT